MRHARIALVLLLVVGTTVLYLRRGTDDDKIRAQLARLAAVLHTTDAQANPIFRIPRLRSEFDEIFDDTFHASIPELPSELPRDRRGLADVAAQVTATHPNLDVDFRDVEIKLDDAHTTAQVASTVTVTADSGGGRTHTTRPVSLLFYKRDGTWRITSVTVWAPRGDT
jgi:phosphoribosylformylglycinamidine synthase